MSFYSDEELSGMGLAHVGKNVRLSRHATVYGASRISIGDNARIDDFSVLSAGRDGIELGRHVHIAVMCSLIGEAKIEMGDFSGLSSRVSIYSSSDDYSGAFMTNPTVPSLYKNVDSRPVMIGRHCIVGAGAVILPGTDMREGAALGSLSLAKGLLREFTIYSGVPARAVKERLRGLLEQETKLDNDTRK